MEDVLNSVLDTRGEIVAGIGAGLVMIAGVLAKKFNWFGGAAAGGDGQAIDAVSKQVAALDVRIKRVEVDLEHLPTRVEFHQMSLQLARLDGKINAVEATATATGHGVARLEDHFIRMSGGK